VATNRIETILRVDKFGTLMQTRLPDFRIRPTECLKNQKWRTAAISKTINRLPFYLLKVQNLYERTCYQFLFVVKRGCFEASNINNKSKARKLKVKVKFSHTRYRALGPELIPVYRQSAHR